MALQQQLQVILGVYDAVKNQTQLNQSVTALQLAGITYSANYTSSIGTSPSTLVAAGGCTGLVIINTGAIPVIIKWTPNGGSAATIITLSPGGIVAEFQPDGTEAINTVTAQTGSSTSTIMWFVFN